MTQVNNYPQYIKTIGSTKVNTANSTIVGRDVYVCANKNLVNGYITPPESLESCLLENSDILQIARGIFTEITVPSDVDFIEDLLALDTYVTQNLSSSFIAKPVLPYTDCTLDEVVADCTASNGCGLTSANAGLTAPIGFLYATGSHEASLVDYIFDDTWKGVFWIDPQAPFSTGTEIGSNYGNYIKLRLTNATFWNTPADAPVKRDNFMTSANRVLHLNVGGDFSLRLGDIIYIDFNNIAKFTSSAVGNQSAITGYYYIIKVQHTFTDDYRHETNLFVTQFR